MKLKSGLYTYSNSTLARGRGFYQKDKSFIEVSRIDEINKGFLKPNRYEKNAKGVVAVLLKPRNVKYNTSSPPDWWITRIKQKEYPIVCLHGDTRLLRVEKPDEELFKEIAKKYGLIVNDNYQVLGNEPVKGDLNGRINNKLASDTLGEIVVPGQFIDGKSKIKFYVDKIRRAQEEYRGQVPHYELHDILVNS